ncbi:MAG: tripartite tricarboxylate transporter substrate binding protein [Betaproteobacteria bacterium]|nr:tripartite tricarboxylate transporter substrate binding protein [Betaproteobacteria bacterium]MBI2958765.1 tripartite tricarboxylate transporter substrate binding protein [Betaproteobacteria bacterium]
MTSIAKLVLAVLALGMSAAGVAADEYPSRPVRIINAMAAGGLSDRAVRLITDALARQLGQPVVVENRSGAGGVIGTESAARSPADGYTLLVSMSSTFSIIPAVKKASYDPMKDFVPLGQIWYAPQALVVRPQSGIKTAGELVAYAKANPGKLSFASAGNGTSTHLSILLLQREAGIQVIHVPFRSGGQTVASLLGGQVDAVFSDISALVPHIQSGSLTALGVTAPQRSPLLPNVPTMAESGLPGVSTINWFGLHAITGTPPAVLERLKAAVRAAQLDPAYTAALAKGDMTTGTVGAEPFAEMIRQEAQRLAPVVRESGISFN